MSLLFANHTVTVYPVVETPDPTTKKVPVPTEGTGISRAVQIAPIRGSVRFDSVTGAELLNPYALRCEPDEIGDFPYGVRVVWEDTGMQFRITQRAMLNAADGDFEELNYGKGEMELMEVEL